MTCSDADLLRRLRATSAIWRDLEAGSESDSLRAQRRLRKTYPDEIVRAAVSLQQLRARAAGKFTRAAAMWFTRVGLEQASAEIVARHKAQRFSGEVCDLCCGIGGDTLALADRCIVRAVDHSEAATLCTTFNADVYGVAARVETCICDVQTVDVAGALVQIDPDRRAVRSRRAAGIDDYQPGIGFLRHLIATARGGAVKVSPASDFAAVFPDCEIELVSVQGECKEATIWFGELARPARRSATILPAGRTLSDGGHTGPAPIRPLARFLIDPDPAVKRAGLRHVLAADLSAGRLDGTDCLTSDTLTPTPFAAFFEVDAVYPSDLKALKRAMAAADIGSLEIKPRHVDIDPERLRKQLKLGGTRAATLFLLPMSGRIRAILCRRLSSPDAIIPEPDGTRTRPPAPTTGPAADRPTGSTDSRT